MDFHRLQRYQSDYFRRKSKNYFTKIFRNSSIVLFFISILIIVPHVLGFYSKEQSLFPFPEKTFTAEEILGELYLRGYPKFDYVDDDHFVEYFNGHKIVYTVDPRLQEKVISIFKRFDVPYGSFVAIEPSTGKVLAFSSFSKSSDELLDFNLKSDYPAASLFKIVAAAGVIEEGLLSRSSVFGYRGSPYRLNNKKIYNNARLDRKLITLEDALGKSNNVVFGKIGANILGKTHLQEYAARFQFNRNIDFDFPVEVSKADIPSDRYKIARVSAGFEGANISPLHSSLIAAAVANGGRMPRPFLIEKIIDRNEQVIYEAVTREFKEVISPRAAREVRKMMVQTTKVGTSSKTFRKYAGDLLHKMDIGGKTGTLNGSNPPGLYDWYIGFAPEENAEIALAALVINNWKWRIKGTYVAQSAFKTHFNH